MIEEGLDLFTLEQLQERFPDAKAVDDFHKREHITLIHSLCESYDSALDLAPVLRWLCAPPHSGDIDAQSSIPYGPTPLLRVVQRGHIHFIAAVLDCGADINKGIRGIQLESRLSAAFGMRFITISPLESALSSGAKLARVVCYLLDRGARYERGDLPIYALEFLEHRSRTRAALLTFLLCWRHSPMLRRCMAPGVRDMVVRHFWADRFEV
jgi:hypothetical protein